MSKTAKAALAGTDANNSASTCPECGASRLDGMTCWKQFGALLAWEGNDPELAAEHFLTVASYNLQHPAQFTGEAVAGLRSNLIEHLDHALPVTEIRRRTAIAYSGKRRVLKPEAERRPILRSWNITIEDVYIPDDPQGAASRVRAWASSIRNEL